MKEQNRAEQFRVEHKKMQLAMDKILPTKGLDAFDKGALRARAAHFLMNGAPVFSVNEQNGEYRLLAADGDYYAAKSIGLKEAEVRVYTFSEENAEAFSCIEQLKNKDLGAMDEAHLMRRLVEEFGLTQEDIAALIGRSRPAVANTLRLLTLAPEVVGLVESNQLSAGHARALVCVPQAQQFGFAQECVQRGYTVRETENAVKAFLTPDEEAEAELRAKSAAKNAELKALVQRMRSVLKTKVSLVGNEKKGRICVEYYSPEDLYRLEEYLDMIESFSRD